MKHNQTAQKGATINLSEGVSERPLYPFHLELLKVPTWYRGKAKNSKAEIQKYMRENRCDEEIIEEISDEFCRGFGCARELIFENLTNKYWSMRKAESAFETPAEDDLISRQAVLGIVRDSCADLDSYEDTEILCDDINDIPSVKPKVGRWIRRVGATELDIYFECSECGKKLNWIDRDDFYCSKCGSNNSNSVKEWFEKWDSEIAEMEAEADDE